MIHVIMGLKGSGKTKKLIDSINDCLAHAAGVGYCLMDSVEKLLGLAGALQAHNNFNHRISPPLQCRLWL